MQCGHVEEFCDDEIEKRQKIIATKKGFTIQEHSLYIYAECNKNPCPNKV
jgi:Fur family ferric uptake transcriptional regulator